MALKSIIIGHVLQPAIDKLIQENKSSREISAYCKEHGLDVSNVTVNKYIKEYKSIIQADVKQRVEEIREQAIEQQVTAQMFLEALIRKGYDKLLNGDYDNVSTKDIVAAARILIPTQIQADVTSTICMEDVITTLSTEEGDEDDN